jgi:hypothetical protein
MRKIAIIVTVLGLAALAALLKLRSDDRPSPRLFVQPRWRRRSTGLSLDPGRSGTSRPGTDSVLTQIHIPFSRRGSRHRLPQASLVENTAAAVAAQFDRRPLEGRWLKVEVREQPVVNHPLTGKAVQSPPAAMLLQGRRPLSLLIGEVLIVDRPPAPGV